MKQKALGKNVAVSTSCGAVINSNFKFGRKGAKRAFHNASRATMTTVGTRRRRVSAVPGKTPTG